MELIIDDELHEQFSSVMTLNLFMANGEIIDADIYLVATHRHKTLLLEDDGLYSRWKFINDRTPRDTSTPIDELIPIQSIGDKLICE